MLEQGMAESARAPPFSCFTLFHRGYPIAGSAWCEMPARLSGQVGESEATALAPQTFRANAQP